MQRFLDTCEIERINHDNGDLSVVNSARVSNAKRVDKIVTKQSSKEEIARRKKSGMKLDDGLVRYLAFNNHWTPFAHSRYGFHITLPNDYDWSAFLNWSGNPENAAGFSWKFGQADSGNRTALEMYGSLYGWMRSCPPLGRFRTNFINTQISEIAPVSFAALDLAGGTERKLGEEPHDFPQMIKNYFGKAASDSYTFRMKVPFMIARQLMRSNIGIVYNEVSRRYVSDDPEVWKVVDWRAAPEQGLKQGSGESMEYKPSTRPFGTVEDYSLVEYERRIKAGVAPELARGCLPYTTMTELWMTVTHSAAARIIGLRTKDLSGKNYPQKEIQELAEAMKRELLG